MNCNCTEAPTAKQGLQSSLTRSMAVAQHNSKNSELQPKSVTSKAKFGGGQEVKLMPLH